MATSVSRYRRIQQILFLSILNFGIMTVLNLNFALAQKSDFINPPFVARNSNSMAIQFHLKASDAQRLLPDGILAKSDENGLVIGSLESYTTDQIFGIPSYSISFIAIEAKDINHKKGNDGNWVVWGAITSEEALAYFRHFYNLPFHWEEKVQFLITENNQSLIVGDNLIELSLQRKNEQPIRAEGLANIFSKSETGKILKTQIPWLADGHAAEVVNFKINSGINPTLQLLENAKPFFGLLSKNTFSYSKPETEN